MKHFNMKTLCASLVVCGFASAPVWGQATTTFDYTGDVQEYVVPAGVTRIYIEAYGAEGGTNQNDSTGGCVIGGWGGMAEGELAVTPGETLSIYVGGRGFSGDRGGWNGGGEVCDNVLTCAKGGGASDVRQGGVTFSDRVIVAGGGGGAEWSACSGAAGAGGGEIGGDGTEGFTARNGNGGTQIAGGTGGVSGTTYHGADGTFGIGGASGEHPAGHAGSGGGGWYGGGGSSEDGHGGGGSSYLGGVTDSATTSGVREGNGQITITELCTALSTTVSATEVCFGETITLEASSTLGGTVVWDMDVEDGVAFAPPVGTTTYTATSDNDEDCPFTVEISVLELPEVNAMVDDEEICFQDTVIFSSGGTADSYEWDMGIVDGELTVLTTTTTFTLTGTDDETGCTNESTIEVVVNPLPAVIANASDDEICLGEEVTLSGSGAETYEWTPAPVEDDIAFEPTETGSTLYEVTGTDINGCVNTDTVRVDVFDAIEITLESTTDETTGSDGEIDITVTGGNPAYSFDWDNDGTGDFDDTEDLTGLAGGTYTVVVEDEAGCTATLEVEVNSQLSIGDNGQLTAIQLYPNPTTGNINILAQGEYVYTVSAINGDVLMSSKAVDNETLSLEGYANGIYLVTVTMDDEVRTLKVTKK